MMLTQTRHILKIFEHRTDASYEYVAFASFDEDDQHLCNEVVIPVDDWGDMGKPTKVTITITPGDDLN